MFCITSNSILGILSLDGHWFIKKKNQRVYSLRIIDGLHNSFHNLFIRLQRHRCILIVTTKIDIVKSISHDDKPSLAQQKAET